MFLGSPLHTLKLNILDPYEQLIWTHMDYSVRQVSASSELYLRSAMTRRLCFFLHPDLMDRTIALSHWALVCTVTETTSLCLHIWPLTNYNKTDGSPHYNPRLNMYRCQLSDLKTDVASDDPRACFLLPPLLFEQWSSPPHLSLNGKLCLWVPGHFVF